VAGGKEKEEGEVRARCRRTGENARVEAKCEEAAITRPNQELILTRSDEPIAENKEWANQDKQELNSNPQESE
jgi:hypothetical protein